MKKLFITIMVFMLLAHQQNASATLTGQTKTAQLSVNATVTVNCSVTVTNVSFGSFDSSTATAIQTPSGKITVKCPAGTIYGVGLDKGTYSGGSAANSGTTRSRFMTNMTVSNTYQSTASTVNSTSGVATANPSSTFLAYSLSQDTYGGKNWGNTTASYNADDGVVARIATATTATTGDTLTIYAQITAASAAVAGGNYLDTVNVTLYY